MRVKSIVFIIILLLIAGLVKAEENPFLRDAKIKLANAKRIVIIPFSTTSQDPMGIENRRLLFAIRQGFECMGKLVIPEEDVWALLKEKKLIERENEQAKKLKEQLRIYGFSKEIQDYLKEIDPQFLSEPFMLSLTEEQVKEIAKRFNADIIVRGCIVDYGVMDVSSGSPLSNLIGGVAPFITAQRIGIAIAAGSYIPSVDKQGVIQMTIYLHDGINGRLLYGKSLFSTYKPLFSNLETKFVLLRGALKRALDTFFNELSINN
ncbi:MAG: hypothetical protein NZ900_01085 [Synergistetes bacterium]|nr:hypothetical protein [Synergistota bacterium]MDW8191522.1 hypothetical protein [Synergistota bacterium]